MIKPPTRPILGLVGLAGSGKTSTGRAIEAVHPRALRTAFADPLKRVVHASFGDVEKNTLDPATQHTGRELYQKLGDVLRAIDPHWMVRRMQEYQAANPGRNLIIDDVRLQSEAEWILSHPGSRLLWIRPTHDQRNVYEIYSDPDAHDTERLGSIVYSPYHTLHVDHSTPAMLGDEVTLAAMHYQEVFG